MTTRKHGVDTNQKSEQCSYCGVIDDTVDLLLGLGKFACSNCFQNFHRREKDNENYEWYDRSIIKY